MLEGSVGDALYSITHSNKWTFAMLRDSVTVHSIYVWRGASTELACLFNKIELIFSYIGHHERKVESITERNLI